MVKIFDKGKLSQMIKTTKGKHENAQKGTLKWIQIFKGSQGTWAGDLGRLSQADIGQKLKALPDS